MKTTIRITISFVLLCCFNPTWAGDNVRSGGTRPELPAIDNAELRNNCTASVAQTDLNINNVRARLLAGGDMWSDLSVGSYIIPQVLPGQPEVSSAYASALWIGGYDNAGNLKLAAQTYRQGGNDFWPGPIDDVTLQTDATTCQHWDRHFSVYGSEISDLINDYLNDDDGDGQPDNIVNNTPASSLLQWPGRGNPFFDGELGFSLPNQNLAPFYDENGDGIYNPYDGDVPTIAMDGCSNLSYADQMIWWVFNDVGNIHTESGGDEIGMEIQALSFAYVIDNALNNMSFYRYKLLNKSTDILNDTYFGMWVDPDLGCWDNDYVGCQVEESLGIVYNATLTDPDCGSLGYGEDVPMFGVDFFRGPKNENGEEIGMSSFVVYNNDFSETGNPEEAKDFYGYLSGFWKDDTPIEFGGDGYMEGTTPVAYMYADEPANTSTGAWSECNEANLPGDRRFVQSAGPFTLLPGATNEVVTSAIWVTNIQYPCPTFDKIIEADSLSQSLFDNCFDLTVAVEDVYARSSVLNAVSVFPNPGYFTASQEVTITNIPTRSTISIYTINGRMINQLSNQSSILTWNMKDNKGQFVPMGAYIISIDASASNNGIKAIKWIGGM